MLYAYWLIISVYPWINAPSMDCITCIRIIATYGVTVVQCVTGSVIVIV